MKRVNYDRIVMRVGLVFIILAVIAPLVFTCSATNPRWDFTETGQIGDTIGGTAGPILSLLGSILVYFSFREQYKANIRFEKVTIHDRNFQLLSKLISDYKEVLNKIEDFSNISFAFENTIPQADTHRKDFGQDLGLNYDDEGNKASPELIYINFREIFLGMLLRNSKEVRNYYYSLQIAESIIEKIRYLHLRREEKSYLLYNFSLYFKSMNYHIDSDIRDSIHSTSYIKNEMGDFYRLMPEDEWTKEVVLRNDILVKLDTINKSLLQLKDFLNH